MKQFAFVTSRNISVPYAGNTVIHLDRSIKIFNWYLVFVSIYISLAIYMFSSISFPFVFWPSSLTGGVYVFKIDLWELVTYLGY